MWQRLCPGKHRDTARDIQSAIAHTEMQTDKHIYEAYRENERMAMICFR